MTWRLKERSLFSEMRVKRSAWTKTKFVAGGCQTDTDNKSRQGLLGSKRHDLTRPHSCSPRRRSWGTCPVLPRPWIRS